MIRSHAEQRGRRRDGDGPSHARPRRAAWMAALGAAVSLACLVLAGLALAGCGPGGSSNAASNAETGAPTSAAASGVAPTGAADGATAGPADATTAATPATTTTPATSAAVDRTGWPRVLRFGLAPTEGGADTRERFAPLRDHLAARLGMPVELISTSTYQGVVTAMGNGQVDFAWLGPKSYIEAAKRADAEALLVELNLEGQPGYRCIFIAPAASDITTLAQARGRGFAFTDPNSTSGYVVPAVIINDVFGEPAEAVFREVRFSGSHGTSILRVAAGELELAATNDLDYGKLLQKGAVRAEQVRIVHTSDLIPGSPIVGRRTLPASLKTAAMDALIELGKDPAMQVRFQNGGYEPVTDEAYDIIRALEVE